MLVSDNPIEKKEDDFLNRDQFSEHLVKSFSDWNEKESLVVAIYGEWGSGKSSIIKLFSTHIQKLDYENKPTIIEFNPWSFSEQDNLSEHFFIEIAKELKIRGDIDDEKTAEKLLYYSSLFNLAPSNNTVTQLSASLVIGLGLLGITTNEILDLIHISDVWFKRILLGLGALLVLANVFRNYLSKLSSIYTKKSAYNKKSISQAKKEIKEKLLMRKKKLIVVIDDIDRLNHSEIKQIFKLIRVNADFPNVIYLLAFDRKVVELNLQEQKGVSGEDYLKKIVQLNFDVPFAKPSKISEFFLKEYEKVLSILPESSKKFYDNDDLYWTNIYNSGFKDFFENIRDVKRYMNSLAFNISLMYQGEVMEVNPIDFTAIEAIRLFAPDFYYFMKSQNYLFTSNDDSSQSNFNMRANEVDKQIETLPDDMRQPMDKLIKTLFPQVYTKHGEGWERSWSRDLRVCATSNFDSYFTLIPGGHEEEISQYEMKNILSKVNSVGEFESILQKYMETNKIRKVLQKIQDYTDDLEYIPKEDVQNIVLALFNISDDLPDEKIDMFDFGADMDMMRIIHQLFKRENDKNINFEILKKTIPLSKGLYGPVQKVSLESPKKDKDRDTRVFVLPEDKIEELQKLCLEKIISCQDRLLDSNEFIYIMYRWYEWDEEQTWKGFIDNILADNNKLIAFVGKFVNVRTSHTAGDYASKRSNFFNYKSLGDFVDIDNIKSRFEKIKSENNDLHKENKQIVDFYLENYDHKD